MIHRIACLALILPLLSCGLEKPTAPLPSPAAIDALAERTRLLFDVPGLSLAIVRHGRLVFARGYGLRDRAAGLPVDPDTVFGIGSITKSFTTAALALLVQDGRIGWDDPVSAHLPDFRLSDPQATRALTIRDLVTHRSGLGAGEGDLMLFSRSRFTRDEAVRNAQFLPLRSTPGSRFAYNNLNYVVAGQLIERVSGQPWARFVQTRLMDPLGLSGCHADAAAFLATPGADPDVAIGYHEHGADLLPLPPDPLTAAAAAGGILCSARDLSRWAAMLLAGGSLDGVRILDPAQRDQLWSPGVPIPLSDTASLSGQHVRGYALGWFTEDFDGAPRVWHSGTVAGMVGLVSLLPEQDAGIVILTNQENANATVALAASLSQALIAGAPRLDWLAIRKARQDAAAARRDHAASLPPEPTSRRSFAPDAATLQAYAGLYLDPWRGRFTIARDGDHLDLSVSRAEDLSAMLHPLSPDRFVVHWNDRLFNDTDDAIIRFQRDPAGRVAGATMRLIGADMSFDVGDLALHRIPAAPP